MRGRRAEPQIPVKVRGRLALRGQVARLGKLPVAPGADVLQLADRAVPDHLPDPVEVLVLMALGADLGGELVLVLEIVGADDADLLHAVAQRLLAVDMLAAVHAPVGDESVGVIRRAADHRLNVLLVEALPPVHVLLGPGKLLRPKSQVLLVHVAQGDDILAHEAAEMGFAAAPRADEGDIELVAGGIGTEEFGSRQDKPGGSGESDGSEELTSFHGASLTPRKRVVKPQSAIGTTLRPAI